MASPGKQNTESPSAWRKDSIEERTFGAALICLEGHYTGEPIMGPLSMSKVLLAITRTMEKTHTLKDVR